MTSSKTNPPSPNRYQNRAKSEAKHWLEYAIFTFVVATAFATGYAAYYTSWQWRTADDAEKRQLRAYVSVLPGDIEGFGQPSGQKFTFIRRNYGQTPAYDLGASAIGMDIVKVGTTPPMAYASASGGTIGCGGVCDGMIEQKANTSRSG